MTPPSDDLWQSLASRAGIAVDPPRHAALLKYLELLRAGNEQQNLTRITDLDSARVMHVGDALTLLSRIPKDASNVADVGSGGGILGFVLAIVRPDLRISLIESSKKKCAFLERTIGDLALSNVEVVNARAEEAALGPQRESFDVAVARGVAELVWLVEWCLPLLKVGGRLLAMKGPRHVDELPAVRGPLKKLGGGAIRVHPAGIESLAGHVIVEITKTRPTPAAYPRHPTVAKGRHL